MRRVDRLGWSASLVLDAFGVRVGLRSDSTALLRRAAARWTSVGAHVVTREEAGSGEVEVEGLLSLHCAARDVTAGARPAISLYDGAARLLTTRDAEEAFSWFDLTLRVGVSERSTSHLFVHAGVVAYRGQAILLPGGCLAGKTTLTRALLARGAVYYSDDVALVDEAGWVHPFARPLSVRESAALPQRPVPAESLGASVGTEPLRAGAVVLTAFRAGTAWRPSPVSASAATLMLLPHTGGVRGRPARALAVLSRLLDGAVVLRGTRGEADDCAREILGAMDQRALNTRSMTARAADA